MEQVETFIKEIPLLTRQQRAKLREAAAKHIAGTHDMPQDAPDDIEKKDWLKVRRMAMQQRYASKVAGQTWQPGTDEAFKVHNTGGKPSAIMPYTWRM